MSHYVICNSLEEWIIIDISFLLKCMFKKSTTTKPDKINDYREIGIQVS